MIKSIVSIFSLGTVFLVAGCTHLDTDQSGGMMIRGSVAVVDNPDWSQPITISVNGVPAAVDQNGQYEMRAADQDLIQIKISGEEIFSSVHTFAKAELQSADSGLSIPNIELVQKTPNRRLLTFGGDVMMGRRYLDPQWGEPRLIHDDTRLADMHTVLEQMQPYFTMADFAAVNLETILSPSELPETAPKSVVFYTHPDILEALESIGTDYVSLGNNHTYDYLEDGLETTLAAFDGSPIGFSGVGRDADEALKPYHADLNGVPVSNWGYVGWAGRVTPNQIAETHKGGAAHGTEDSIVQSIQAGARPGQIDIVQYHGSREYSEGPTEISEQRLKAAIDHGADLVIGHHPHVAQGFEIYQGKLVAYSLGNFVFDQFFYATHGTVALNVWMDGDDFYRAEIIPLHIKGYRPVPATNAVRDYVLGRVATLSSGHGTTVGLSGGHGIIHPGQAHGEIPAYKDTLFIGDFETYGLFGGDDRNWYLNNAQKEIVKTAHQGEYALRLSPIDAAEPVEFGLKTFMRVFPAESMKIHGTVKVEAGAKISAFVQYRPKGVNRYKALETAPLEPTGEQVLQTGDWQRIEFDFPSPEAPLREGRFILKIEGSAGPILIDDIQILPASAP